MSRSHLPPHGPLPRWHFGIFRLYIQCFVILEMSKSTKDLLLFFSFFHVCDGTERKGHRWTSMSDCSHANAVPASYDEEWAELTGGKLRFTTQSTFQPSSMVTSSRWGQKSDIVYKKRHKWRYISCHLSFPFSECRHEEDRNSVWLT